MNSQIEQELDRIVNGEAIKVSDMETSSEANRRIKLDTANCVYELPANRFLIFLQRLPDQIGVEALRQAIEERFPSVVEQE
ncbi:MAG: hypothetical protein KDA52_09900 [Planctomycetaceae bacterium]|nr:hypothetical protein [Planctomycetaceae bacterium]